MTASPTADGSSQKRDRSLRSYSKKHRVYVFREFLLETYGDYLSRNDTTTGQPIVLDVAGGKGDLSWLLCNVDDWKSVVVDPRRTVDRIARSVEFLKDQPEECALRALRDKDTYQPIAALMPQLRAKNYCLTSPAHLRIFVDSELIDTLRTVLKPQLKQQDPTTVWTKYWNNAVQRSEGFVTPTGKNDVVSLEDHSSSNASSANIIMDADRALEAILQTRLVLGFHPDQATDYCFELAALLQVPVCVVPCCVFPSEFPHRTLIRTSDGGGDNQAAQSSNSSENSSTPVEKYDELIQYLRQQYPEILMETLPFVGTTTARNIVLYTLPTL